ncbi:MAG: TIGR03016 family PEP-CTERM system-associated outer membrane protein [Nitrospirota bacterium]
MSRTNLKAFIFIPVLLVLSLYSYRAECAEFSIRPSIDLIQEYNDNIFLSKGNQESDYITRIMPSVNMNYRTPFWDWRLDYTLNWWYYHKLGKNYDSHLINLASHLNIINNFLYLDVNDNYSNIALDQRRPSNENNLNVNRTDTNNLTVSPYIKYKITPVDTLTAGYRYTNIWYREEEGINRQMHTGYATIEHVFNPKFNAAIGVEYTADRPENTEPDNDQTAVFVRGAYVISERTNLDGTLRYIWIDFSNNNKEENISYNFGLVHRFHQMGEIQLRISSDILTSALYGIHESRTEQLTIRYGETFTVNGSVFHREDKYLETDLKDKAIGITTGFEYRPDPRLTFIISGTYEKNNYLPEDEDREIYRAFGEIAYQLTRKANLILRDTYTKENGRTGIEDYRNNIISIKVRITI